MMIGHFIREQYDDVKLLLGEAAYFGRQVHTATELLVIKSQKTALFIVTTMKI